MKWLLILIALAGCGDDDTTLTAEQLRDPQACKKCHPNHFQEWSGSMHAYASDDPVFIAMNKRGQRETGGMLGNFCVKCHAPMVVAMGATTDGLNLAQLPAELHGVTCYFCHTVDSVQGTHNNPLHLEPAAVTMRGEYKDAIKNGVHKSAYSTLHDYYAADSASLCGSCHDIVTPMNAQIERTFQEWQGSVFSHLTGNTCSNCHMNTTPQTTIADFPGVPGGRTRFSHQWPAIDSAFIDFPEKDAQQQAIKDLLHTELSSALCVADYGDGTAAIRVILDNLAAGHGFPSGSAQDRRMWVEIKAYNAAGQVIYQSGVVPDGQAPTMNPDTGHEADYWLLRDCMLDSGGHEATMFWNAANVELPMPPQAYLLPAQTTNMALKPEYYYSHIQQYYPNDKTMHPIPMPDHVTMRVRVQPIGLDVLDDLLSTCQMDGTCDTLMPIRAAMPTYDIDTDQSAPVGASPLLTWTMATAKLGPFDDPEGMRFPNYCVTTSALNIVAKTYPATKHTVCTP
jgi:hypothetical protein